MRVKSKRHKTIKTSRYYINLVNIFKPKLVMSGIKSGFA